MIRKQQSKKEEQKTNMKFVKFEFLFTERQLNIIQHLNVWLKIFFPPMYEYSHVNLKLRFIELLRLKHKRNSNGNYFEDTLGNFKLELLAILS